MTKDRRPEADPATVLALRRRADQLMDEGRLFEAIDAHRNLIEVRPDLAEGWFNLAYLERAAHQFRPALDSYGKALALGISRPEEVHVNRAVIFSEYLELPDEAEKELRSALAANPSFVIAWLNLGNLFEDRGDRQEAAAAYRSALAIDPGNARALARIGPGDIHQPREATGGLSKERKARFSATLIRGTAAFFNGSSGRPKTLYLS